MQELAGFAPFSKAAKAVVVNIESLEQRLANVPRAPANVHAALNAREILEHMRALETAPERSLKAGMPEQATRPAAFAEANLADPDIVAAWLWSKPFQSGLSDSEYNTLREKVRNTLNPTSAEAIKSLTRALEELADGSTGMRAVKKVIMERCALEQYADGSIRMRREPAPKRSLHAAERNLSALRLLLAASRAVGECSGAVLEAHALGAAPL